MERISWKSARYSLYLHLKEARSISCLKKIRYRSLLSLTLRCKQCGFVRCDIIPYVGVLPEKCRSRRAGCSDWIKMTRNQPDIFASKKQCSRLAAHSIIQNGKPSSEEAQNFVFL